MKKMYVISSIWIIIVAVTLLTGCASKKKVIAISPDIVMDDNIEVQDDYILLRMYRNYAIKAAGGSFDVYLDNEKIYRAKNNSKSTIKITKEGMKTLKAVFYQYSDELPIDLQFGNEYYIRCMFGKMEGLVQKPTLEFMDDEKGKLEFDKIPSVKK